MKNNNKLRIGLFIAAGFIAIASACKKDPKSSFDPGPVIPPSAAPTRAELTKDSIYLYAKETYYWNEGMPSYDVFKPRTYADDQTVLDAIRALPGTGKPLWTTQSDPVPREKYSFLDDGTVSSELNGVSGDYGFSVFYNGGPSSDLRIKYVSPNSPAAAAGLKRGYRITKLNGRTDLLSSSDVTIKFIQQAIFGGAGTVTMTIQKPDNSTQEVSVTRASYVTSPVFYKNIYPVGNKKVGYIVYNSFTTNSWNELTNIFGDFAAQGVNELIVDLRYNGGGSVATADVFTNLIAPSSASGKVMYTTYWTKTMREGKANILSNQPLLDANGRLQPWSNGVNGVYATYADFDFRPTKDAGNVELFEKKGSANITKVYFLVLSGTASASELMINNLKPFVDVKLIGQKTYGKPVGFFAIRIDKTDLYIPQFETKNSLDEGGYYDGMIPDFSAPDDVTKDFGDPEEGLLAIALNHAETGIFTIKRPENTISSLRGMSVFEEARLTEELDRNRFKGMIDDKLKLKR